MSVQKPCDICSQRIATYQCNNCRRFVCDLHYSPRQNQCVDCAENNRNTPTYPRYRI